MNDQIGCGGFEEKMAGAEIIFEVGDIQRQIGRIERYSCLGMQNRPGVVAGRIKNQTVNRGEGNREGMLSGSADVQISVDQPKIMPGVAECISDFNNIVPARVPGGRSGSDGAWRISRRESAAIGDVDCAVDTGALGK